MRKTKGRKHKKRVSLPQAKLKYLKVLFMSYGNMERQIGDTCSNKGVALVRCGDES